MPHRTPSAPRLAPMSARSAALLDQIRAVYVAEGFAGTSLDAIAARLGCSKTTLYNMAETRAELNALVVDLHFRLAAERLAAKTEAHNAPADRLRAYLLGIADETRAVSPEFIHDISRAPSARRVYEQWVGRTADQIRALIADGITSGEFREVHATFLGEVATAVMQDIEYGDLRERTNLTHAEAYEHLADTIVNTVTVDSALPSSRQHQPPPRGHRR